MHARVKRIYNLFDISSLVNFKKSAVYPSAPIHYLDLNDHICTFTRLHVLQRKEGS